MYHQYDRARKCKLGVLPTSRMALVRVQRFDLGGRGLQWHILVGYG